EVARPDFEWLKQLCQLTRRDRLSVAPFGPGSILQGGKLLCQNLRRDPVVSKLGEDAADVLQHHDAGGRGRMAGDPLRNAPATRRPVASGEVGNGKERPPVVGCPAVEARRQFRISSTERSGIVGGEARGLSLQGLKVAKAIESERLHPFGRCLA